MVGVGGTLQMTNQVKFESHVKGETAEILGVRFKGVLLIHHVLFSLERLTQNALDFTQRMKMGKFEQGN